jgi:biopolymer transport protein ExbD/biopolymer transport protein TolR
VFVATNRRRQIRAKLAASKRRAPGEVKSDINVTPLVDVVLVLLIIFMVVTPIIAGGVPVELPKTVHHARKPDDGQDIVISVTTDQRVYVYGKPVAATQDVTRLVEEERRKHPEKAVFVKGDTRTTYGVVREVMEAVHKAGLDNVMLGTEEVKDKP